MSLRKVYAEEGIRGLYRGNDSTMLIHGRLFYISVLHPTVPHDLLPALRAGKVEFQEKVWLAGRVFPTLCCLCWRQRPLLQHRYESLLGSPDAYAGRDIPIGVPRPLQPRVPRHLPFDAQDSP